MLKIYIRKTGRFGYGEQWESGFICTSDSEMELENFLRGLPRHFEVNGTKRYLEVELIKDLTTDLDRNGKPACKLGEYGSYEAQVLYHHKKCFIGRRKFIPTCREAKHFCDRGVCCLNEDTEESVLVEAFQKLIPADTEVWLGEDDAINHQLRWVSPGFWTSRPLRPHLFINGMSVETETKLSSEEVLRELSAHNREIVCQKDNPIYPEGKKDICLAVTDIYDTVIKRQVNATQLCIVYKTADWHVEFWPLHTERYTRKIEITDLLVVDSAMLIEIRTGEENPKTKTIEVDLLDINGNKRMGDWFKKVDEANNRLVDSFEKLLSLAHPRS